jgi:hypothetical protein
MELTKKFAFLGWEKSKKIQKSRSSETDRKIDITLLDRSKNQQNVGSKIENVYQLKDTQQTFLVS